MAFKNCQIPLYADDTIFLSIFKYMNAFISFNSIQQAVADLKLELNPYNTTLMIFSKIMMKTHLHSCLPHTMLSMNLSNSIIMYLGVWIDHSLSFGRIWMV